MSKLPAFEVYVFGAPGVRKGTDLGEIFPNLRPRADGDYLLELAAILPDRLPNLNGSTDYWIDLPDGEATTRVCFSNQMCRLLFSGENGTAFEAYAARAALLDAQEKEKILASAPAEPLATVATCRFRVSGVSAEKALEEALSECPDRFVRLLNKVVSATIVLQKDAIPSIVAEYERNTFPTMMFMIQGAGDEIRQGRFAVNLLRSTLNPNNLAGDDAQRLLAMAVGAVPLSDVGLLLNSARSFLAGGMTRQALLQLAVACETATRRYVHAALLATGTSKGKLHDVEKDLTFSIMLNVLLFSVAPVQSKPNRDLVGEIDTIRRLRNNLMHEGTFDGERDVVQKLYNHANRFVDYLREIAQYQGLPTL